MWIKQGVLGDRSGSHAVESYAHWSFCYVSVYRISPQHCIFTVRLLSMKCSPNFCEEGRKTSIIMWDPFRDFEESMRRMMGGAGSLDGSRFLSQTSFGRWIPPMDLTEDETHFTLTADIPGMKKEDMEVNVTGSRVCIRANRVIQDADGKKGWVHCSERGYGKFERCFTLPSRIVEKGVGAQYHDGVLEVRLEKVTPGTSPNSPTPINIR